MRAYYRYAMKHIAHKPLPSCLGWSVSLHGENNIESWSGKESTGGLEAGFSFKYTKKYTRNPIFKGISFLANLLFHRLPVISEF